MNLEREGILELIKDMDEYAGFKKIDMPPIYLMGGSGSIICGYINRATRDIDLLDLGYPAKTGTLFRLLGQVDYLDWSLTTVAPGYETRATKIEEFDNISVYVLSREDIITSKIGRYSIKDQEDISSIMKFANFTLILDLINQVMNRNDLSTKVKEAFIENAGRFKDAYV